MATAPASFGAGPYPALRPSVPVLRRGPGELQVGLDQQPAIVLAGVPDGLEPLIRLFDGTHSLTDLRVRCAALAVAGEQLDWCLRTLGEAGLLADPRSPRHAMDDRQHRREDDRVRSARVRLVGAGRLGRAVAELLVSSGIADLHLVDGEPADPSSDRLVPAEQTSSVPPRTRAQSLAAGLDRSTGTRVSVVNHWSKPDGLVPQLTVLAGDRLESDRLVSDGLLRDDQPHLLLRGGTQGAVVGPLVLPGRTACVRCTDHARSDADPAWPVLLPQLARNGFRLSPAAVAWAASVATTQALAFLQGGAPESCGATIELSVPDYLTGWRPWAMHPGCGCGWGSTAQWNR